MAAWMPLYWGDYLRKTLHLSLEEHGAYLLLVAAYWERGRALPDDDRYFSQVLKLSLKKWKIMRPKISEFFEISEGHWHHVRVENEIVRSSNRQAAAIANGKAGGLAKSKLSTSTSTTTEEERKKEDSSKSPPAMLDMLTPHIPKTNGKKPKKDIPDGFDLFWAEYPRRDAKGDAVKAYRDALKRAGPEVILAGAKRYATAKVAEERKFLKLPGGWLRDDRWLDEPEKPNGQGGLIPSNLAELQKAEDDARKQREEQNVH